MSTSRKGENPSRISREKATHEVDYTVPVKPEQYAEKEGCFGRMWDMGTKECKVCADCELCGILFQQEVKKRVADIEKEEATFLDLSDFEGLNPDELKVWLSLKERTVEELFEKIKKIANTDDDETVVIWMKRFIKESPTLYTKDGVVKVRKK